MSQVSLEIENFHNVTLDDMKLVLSQAEKKLDDSIKNIDATTTKSISFITLSATFLVAQAAYFFTNFDINGTFDPKLFTIFISSCYTFGILLYLTGTVLPQTYFPVGSNPEDLFINDFFIDEFKEKDLTTKYLYLAEIESYSRRIKHNFLINSTRLARLRFSIKAICWLPVFALSLYFCTIGAVVASFL